MQDIPVLALVATILGATWRMATPIIYTAVGGMFAERSGVLNIGFEGVMLVGAFTGFAMAAAGMPPYVALLLAMLAGALCGAAFAWLTVTMKADQIVVGAAFTLLGLGITGFLYRSIGFDGAEIRTLEPVSIPFLSDLPILGPALFRHTLLVYLTLPLVLAAQFVLYRTSYGLSLRSAGDYPRALAAAGQDVNRYRFSAVVLSCALAGIGGAFLTLSYTNQFVEGIVSGRGYMALAVIVFGRWTPFGIFGASLLFGFFFALQLTLQSLPQLGIPYQVFQAMPYFLTVVALVLIGGRSVAPKYLAIPFRR
jgi:simple sugar transport system permease protein